MANIIVIDDGGTHSARDSNAGYIVRKGTLNVEAVLSGPREGATAVIVVESQGVVNVGKNGFVVVGAKDAPLTATIRVEGGVLNVLQNAIGILGGNDGSRDAIVVAPGQSDATVVIAGGEIAGGGLGGSALSVQLSTTARTSIEITGGMLRANGSSMVIGPGAGGAQNPDDPAVRVLGGTFRTGWEIDSGTVQVEGSRLVYDGQTLTGLLRNGPGIHIPVREGANGKLVLISRAEQ